MTLAPLESIGRWVEVVGPAASLSEKIAGTEFVPGAMRGKPDVVLAAILYGDEIGVGPMQALAGIHIIDGRPAPSAELMRSLILRAGHQIQVHEFSGTKVRVSGLRRGDPEAGRVVVEWTQDMARAAGLLGRQNWQRYPRAMLLARATSDLGRLLFPDVIKGLGYVAEDTVEDLERWAAPEVQEIKAPARKRVARAQRPKVPDVREEPERRPTVAAIDPWAEPTPEEEPPTPDPVAPSRPSEQEAPALPPQPEPPSEEEAPVAPPLPRHEPASPPPSQDQPLLPDLEPEAGPNEPEISPPDQFLIGPGMLRGVQATLGRVLKDQAGDRDLRLELLTAIAGRRILTTKELTKEEALHAAMTLMRIENGEISWIRTPEHGVVLVEDLPGEP